MVWNRLGYRPAARWASEPDSTPGTILAPVASDDLIHPDGMRMGREWGLCRSSTFTDGP